MDVVWQDIYVCSSHGLFNDNALSILEESPVRMVFVTNSVPLPEHCTSSKIEQVREGSVTRERGRGDGVSRQGMNRGGWAGVRGGWGSECCSLLSPRPAREGV